MADKDEKKAFPGQWDHGMSLRDYFAARAMQGLIEYCGTHAGDNEQQLAEKSYRIADAMLLAREFE